MLIAFFLYNGVTALDFVGPYEVLSRMPGADVKFVSADGGMVRSDTSALAVEANCSIDEIESSDIIVVPGGPGNERVIADARVLDWLRRVHATTTYTTSVCTGSLILAAAGLLDGLEATTHWAFYDRLAELGARPTGRRVVRSGKVITGAGVSAGIDMALELLREQQGDEFAQAIQLGIEYDPQPPFDAGSPEKAPAHIVELLRAHYAERRSAAVADS